MAHVIFRISLNGDVPDIHQGLNAIKNVLKVPGFGDFRRIGGRTDCSINRYRSESRSLRPRARLLHRQTRSTKVC